MKRGATDIRDDDDVSYSIATSGITATVNNTPGDADKGKITATGGTSGHIDLTVLSDEGDARRSDGRFGRGWQQKAREVHAQDHFF